MRLVERLGWTEGQLYTLVIAFALGLGLFVTGIPPALRDRPPAVTTDTVFPPPVRSEFGTPRAPAPIVSVVAVPLPGLPPALIAPALPRAETPASPRSTLAKEGPLRMKRTSYTSTAAGTPAASLGVPKDALPVAARAGRLDKQSFFTIGGVGAALELVESGEAGANQLPEQAAVRMCKVLTAGWAFERGSSHESAPVYDASLCVDGTRSVEGLWRFELSGFSAIDDDAGFALVPVLGAGATFQVCLEGLQEPTLAGSGGKPSLLAHKQTTHRRCWEPFRAAKMRS